MTEQPVTDARIKSMRQPDEPPADLTAMKQAIVARRQGFTPQVEQVLKVSLERPDLVAFGTQKTVAETIGVGQTTVIRAAKSLGFESFREYRKVFRAWLVSSQARRFR